MGRPSKTKLIVPDTDKKHAPLEIVYASKGDYRRFKRKSYKARSNHNHRQWRKQAPPHLAHLDYRGY